MPHIHIGLPHLLVGYFGWLVIHILVVLVGIQFHTTRIGQAMATFG